MNYIERMNFLLNAIEQEYLTIGDFCSWFGYTLINNDKNLVEKLFKNLDAQKNDLEEKYNLIIQQISEHFAEHESRSYKNPYNFVNDGRTHEESLAYDNNMHSHYIQIGKFVNRMIEKRKNR